jgi:branched-chain amino acid transport system permease protein
MVRAWWVPWARAGALVALAGVPLTGSAYYTNLLLVVALHATVALGLTLLMGFAGQVSIGQAAFYGLGAYLSALLSLRAGWSPWASLVASAALVGWLADGLGRLIFRLRGHYLAVATLGFGIIVSVAFTELRDWTGGPNGLPGIPPLRLLGLAFDNDFRAYYLAWAACLAGLGVARNLGASPMGRALRAIRGGERAAAAAGIDLALVKRRTFVLSAVYGAVPGSLYAHYLSFVSPQPFSFLFSVRLIVMVVIGGLTSPGGTLFGAALVTLLSQWLHAAGEFEVMGFGLLMILVMVCLPRGAAAGLAGLVRRLREERR